MDRVDELSGNLTTLEELNVTDREKSILAKLSDRLSGSDFKYLVLNRGRSEAKKIIIKPSGRFPLISKIGKTSLIDSEVNGYRILKGMVPSTCLSELHLHLSEGDMSGVCFSYITDGRIINQPSRLDVYATQETKDRCVNVILYLLDDALKKCHFADGLFTKRQASFYALPAMPKNIGSDEYSRAFDIYEQIKWKANDIKCPHSIIHGDLHPKNIIITRMHSPIIIDYSMVATDSCIFNDYAKLEIFLQFQIIDKVSTEYHWKNIKSIYNKEILIFPGNFGLIGYMIHTIRSILWKNCMSNVVGMSAFEVDSIYRVYLARHLLSIFLRKKNRYNIGYTDDERKMAFSMANYLLRN